MSLKWARRLIILVLVLLAIVAAYTWYFFCGGVTHRDLADSISRETEAICRKVDERSDGVELRLVRIEDKLDRILKLAEPRVE